MMLSRISRSISRSSRSSLLNAIIGCDGGARTAVNANQSGGFGCRSEQELGFFNTYFTSVAAAKRTAPSFSSVSRPNFANPIFSRFFSTDAANKTSSEMKVSQGEHKNVPISNRVAGLYHTALSPLFHIEEGVNEIIADYVHHEMTRAFIMWCCHSRVLFIWLIGFAAIINQHPR